MHPQAREVNVGSVILAPGHGEQLVVWQQQVPGSSSVAAGPGAASSGGQQGATEEVELRGYAFAGRCAAVRHVGPAPQTSAAAALSRCRLSGYSWWCHHQWWLQLVVVVVTAAGGGYSCMLVVATAAAGGTCECC
jgi:hypothetical protein